MGGAGPAPHLQHRAAQAVQLPERAADGALPLGGPGAQGAGAPGAGAPLPHRQPGPGERREAPVRHQGGLPAGCGAGAPGSRQHELEMAAHGTEEGGEPAGLAGLRKHTLEHVAI